MTFVIGQYTFFLNTEHVQCNLDVQTLIIKISSIEKHYACFIASLFVVKCDCFTTSYIFGHFHIYISKCNFMCKIMYNTHLTQIRYCHCCASVLVVVCTRFTFQFEPKVAVMFTTLSVFLFDFLVQFEKINMESILLSDLFSLSETTVQIGLVCDSAAMFIRWTYPKCVLGRSKYQNFPQTLRQSFSQDKFSILH